MAGEISATSRLKTALRQEVIAARDALPPARRGEFSARITRELLGIPAYRRAGCVLAYMSIGSEFDTAMLVADALAGGKTLCLPRVDRATRSLEVRLIENPESDLVPGVWGIREPRSSCALADLECIDFVLLPGVAFTPRCERLGYGGGFYDRLITQFKKRPLLVAAAFALQVRAQIPLAAGDQRIDLVVTEDSCYDSRGL